LRHYSVHERPARECRGHSVPYSGHKSCQNLIGIGVLDCKQCERHLPMAVKRVIEGVHVVSLGMANAFLIKGDDGLALIDAGYPRKEAAVFGAIRGLGRSPDQLRQLIFTHGHLDHIGSAAAIVRETAARTYMRPRSSAP
jgi:glyoxylase-like metal-dependent hydrolase (beta-lactamase superfamily II)